MPSNDVLMQLEAMDRSHEVDPNLNRFCLAWVLLEGMNAIQSKIMINTLTLTPTEPKKTKGQKDLAVQTSRSSRAGPSSSTPTEGVPGQQCTQTQDKLNKQHFWTQIVKASTKANIYPVFSPAGLSRFQLFMAKLLLALIDPSKHGDQTSVDQIRVIYEHLTESDQASIKLRLPKTFQFHKDGHVINMPKLTIEDQKKAELILQYLPSRKTMLEYLAAHKWQKGIEGAASISAALPHENNILTREKPLTTQSMRLFWNLANRSNTPQYMITPGVQVVLKTGAELALGGLEAGAGRQSTGMNGEKKGAEGGGGGGKAKKRKVDESMFLSSVPDLKSSGGGGGGSEPWNSNWPHSAIYVADHGVLFGPSKPLDLLAAKVPPHDATHFKRIAFYLQLELGKSPQIAQLVGLIDLLPVEDSIAVRLVVKLTDTRLSFLDVPLQQLIGGDHAFITCTRSALDPKTSASFYHALDLKMPGENSESLDGSTDVTELVDRGLLSFFFLCCLQSIEKSTRIADGNEKTIQKWKYATMNKTMALVTPAQAPPDLWRLLLLSETRISFTRTDRAFEFKCTCDFANYMTLSSLTRQLHLLSKILHEKSLMNVEMPSIMLEPWPQVHSNVMQLHASQHPTWPGFKRDEGGPMITDIIKINKLMRGCNGLLQTIHDFGGAARCDESEDEMEDEMEDDAPPEDDAEMKDLFKSWLDTAKDCIIVGQLRFGASSSATHLPSADADLEKGLEGEALEKGLEGEAQDKVMSDAQPEVNGKHQEATSGAAQAALDNGGSVGHQPTSGSIEEGNSKPT